MKLQTKIAVVLGALALATAPAPAMALANQSSHSNGHSQGNGPNYTPAPEKLSPGQACKGMSKKHVKGEKGTPFSKCVKAAAKLRKDQQR
jgi:hypothetical protein